MCMRRRARCCWPAVSPRRRPRPRCSAWRRRCGLPTVDIDITFNSITMCCHRGMVARAAHDDAARPLPHHRPHPAGRGDPHRRAGGAPSAVRATGPRRSWPTPSRPTHPYPRWAATLGWAGQAAAVAVLLGGAPIIAATAFAVTALIDRLGRLLGRFGVAPFFLQIVGAVVATVSTLALFGIGALPAGTQPVAGHRGGHHRAALRAVGGRHRAGRDLRLLRHRGGPGGRGRRCCPRGCSPVSSSG